VVFACPRVPDAVDSSSPDKPKRIYNAQWRHPGFVPHLASLAFAMASAAPYELARRSFSGGELMRATPCVLSRPPALHRGNEVLNDGQHPPDNLVDTGCGRVNAVPLIELAVSSNAVEEEWIERDPVFGR
jgi:hypothetical protein